jgi:X-X-X-Leu-X-X-Gly heptad repeat protein
MKKFLSAITAIALIVSLSSAGASPDMPQKEEVVYGILDTEGNVEEIYVVNIFRGGDITDYGEYSSVKNLTTSDAIEQNGDLITVRSCSDRLYYQGTLESKELPWNIQIRYTLDGTPVSGPALAGKTGRLEIRITVTRNPNTDSTFFDNYALQIGVKLDADLCDLIETKDATVAQAGSDKQLSYTVLPGSEADISIKADVHDFDMDAITINGIRLSLSMDIDKTELLGQLNELTGAIAQLDDGAGELLAGAVELSGGVNSYISGLSAFASGMAELDRGVGDLSGGAAELSEGLSALARQNETLQKGASDIMQSAFDAVNLQISQSGMELPVLTPENYRTVLENIPGLADVMARLDGAVSFTKGIIDYTNAVAGLGAGAAELGDGLTRLKNSVSALSRSAADLFSAGTEIGGAVEKLRDGLSSYKDGTSELRTGTDGMDTQLNLKIDDILKTLTGGGESASPSYLIKTSASHPCSL